MNKRTLFFLLLLLAALPAQAHHTKEHLLGAPSPEVPPHSEAAGPSGVNFWLALGPFFALAGLGALRWGYRGQRKRKTKNPRVEP